MDFIEKLLGFSPDGGDGSLESIVLLVLIGGIVLATVAVRRGAWQRRR